MKKAAAYALLIFLGVASFVPPAAHAGAHSAQQSWKKYMKQQQKAQKKEQKSQAKATRNWNKQHHNPQW
jgi:60S ribosome biogenesis protein Rrp14